MSKGTRSNAPEPVFLSLEQVHAIHRRSLREFGGLDGVRDQGLLESAVAMPSAQFFGRYAHEDLFEMAAAYAFHISQGQAYLDGNKRTGLAAALIFLAMNGIVISSPPRQQLFRAMIRVTKHQLDKKGLAEVFRGLALRSRPPLPPSSPGASDPRPSGR